MTVEMLKETIEKEQQKPIFRIMMMEYEGNETDELGFAHIGATNEPGFFYDLDEAVSAVTDNAADIREQVFDAAMILCTSPGVYRPVDRHHRLYFVWDDKTEKYTLKDEPEALRGSIF